MSQRFVCVQCDGEKCLHCGGRGWLTEQTVQRERTRELIEVVAKNLIEKQIAVIGPEEWARRAAEMDLTPDQYTEVEVWSATGPISCQFMALSNEVLDILASLLGIEVPPVWVPDVRIVGWP
jgi:hypothetical protein